MAKADAQAYGYELVTVPAPTAVKSGAAYGYELARVAVPIPAKNAYAYGTENVASNPNPTQLKTWDGTQWVRKPYYVWNGTAWVQIT